MVTAFPFSAPRFTEEQQSKERASLRDDEKDLIRKDLYGKGLEDQHPEETQAFVSTKLQEMQEALDNIENKAALNEALETVPHLVDEESPRLAFLRCEHYDAELAAKRLVQYWRYRVMFFGSEKAFLPMTLNGAMMGQEEYLREGSTLQWVGNDERGRPIVLHEAFRPRVAHLDNKQMIYQAFFYIVQIIFMSSKTAQLDGMVVLTNAKTYDLRTFDRKLVKKLIEWLTDAAPCKISADHILSGPSFQNLFVSLVMPIMMALFSRHLRQRVLFHCGNDIDNVNALQEQYGIPPMSIPTGLGGEWTMENYEEWVTRQIFAETVAADNMTTTDNNNKDDAFSLSKVPNKVPTAQDSTDEPVKIVV